MSINSSSVNNTTGIQIPKDACVVIIRTEWNSAIIDALEKGCTHILANYQVPYKIINVPGAFEIGFCINKYWDKHKYRDDRPHAFIALGCVLKGGTPHFEYVSKAVTDAIVQLNLTLPIPTIFGVLTLDNEEQAIERTGGKHGHKGEEAALTALKMMSITY
jgi:6,7-dimethyl-8-ribityllumazine synthase